MKPKYNNSELCGITWTPQKILKITKLGENYLQTKENVLAKFEVNWTLDEEDMSKGSNNQSRKQELSWSVDLVSKVVTQLGEPYDASNHASPQIRSPHAKATILIV